MNVKKVAEELRRKYPGKKIIKNNKKHPTEILCEVEPCSEHPEYSLAVSVLDRSTPHLHKKTKEKYKVIRGKLKVFKEDEEYNLKEGDELVINSGQVHWAEGNETWIECYSKPGWTLEDHILEEKR